jgi:hypothetical protein
MENKVTGKDGDNSQGEYRRQVMGEYGRKIYRGRWKER